MAGGAKIFFATDGVAMRNLLLRLPSAVTRRSIFPPAGSGRIYNDYERQGYTDTEAARDTVVDMLLLARCNALIRNGSVFNLYAQIVTDYFNGNVRNIESLYARYWLRTARIRARRLVAR